MKDAQRLALLKEVGGTKIYEERRRESLKLMAETEGRQLRIQEVVFSSTPPPLRLPLTKQLCMQTRFVNPRAEYDARASKELPPSST